MTTAQWLAMGARLEQLETSEKLPRLDEEALRMLREWYRERKPHDVKVVDINEYRYWRGGQ